MAVTKFYQLNSGDLWYSILLYKKQANLCSAGNPYSYVVRKISVWMDHKIPMKFVVNLSENKNKASSPEKEK